MVTFPTPKNIAFNTFGGIRLRNGIISDSAMTATVARNIDFVPQGLSSNMKIQSSLGNSVVATLTGYTIIKCFETVQDGTRYCLVYAENTTNGILAKLNADNTFTTIIDGTSTGYTLTKTGKANGITMVDSAYDVFVLTNGIEYYSVSFAQTPSVVKLSPQYNSEDVTGLAICEQDGSLVIGSEKGYVIASRKGDITDWDYVTPTDTNKSWYQLFGKAVTAVVPYINGLIVFTAEDSTILSGNMSDADSATRENASLGGCFSYESWVLHDKYLFFYDNNQKNIYFFVQNDYGQNQLGDPVAVEIQEMLDDITRFQFVSYVGNNRNEIWVLTNNNKFVWDYFCKEWTERYCQGLNCYFKYDNDIYSVHNNQILREKDGLYGYFGYVNSSNKGTFYGSQYTMQSINLSSPSNLKEMELPPIFTVTSDFGNNFWVYALVDDKKTKSKQLIAPANKYGAFYNSTKQADSRNKWDSAKFAPSLTMNTKQLKGKQISNFYTVKFTIQTSSEEQNFSISSFELKQITQEYDTMGHK